MIAPLKPANVSDALAHHRGDNAVLVSFLEQYFLPSVIHPSILLEPQTIS
jgi:hypothetical protein